MSVKAVRKFFIKFRQTFIILAVSILLLVIVFIYQRNLFTGAASFPGDLSAETPFISASEYIPNQILVKLRSRAPVGEGEGGGFQSSRVAAVVGSALSQSDLRVTSVKPMIKPISPMVPAGFSEGEGRTQAQQRRQKQWQIERATGLDRWMIVDIKSSSPVDITAIAAGLKSDANIESAEPNYITRAFAVPNDPFFSSFGSWNQPYDDLWGVKKIQADQVWRFGNLPTWGKGVVVAVVDTGVAYDHPDLAANIWRNVNEMAGNGIDDDGNGFVDDVRGWDFYNNDNDPRDDNGHGSHVTGIIAAVAHNNKGVVGVAPLAKIMPVKGLNQFGQGTDVALFNAVKYAVDNGADIINNSWGGPSNSAHADIFDYAYRLGVISVAATGNDQNDASRFSPANLPTTIAVAATTEMDTKAHFSNFGNIVDIAAPGGGHVSCLNSGSDNDCTRNILSTVTDGSTIIQNNPQLKVIPPNGSDDGYYRIRGTSMAAPYISGAAALVLAQHPSFTNEEVRSVLKSTSEPIPILPTDTPFYIGQGRVNALRASAVATPLPYGWLMNLGSVGSTGSVEIRGFAKGSNFIRYDLYYGEGENPANWSLFKTSTFPINGDYSNPGILGDLNITGGLAEGIYTVKLVVTAVGGKNVEYRTTLSVIDDQLPPFSLLFFTDDFNRPDSPSAGLNWQQRKLDSLVGIRGNRALGSFGTPSATVSRLTMTDVAVSAEIDVRQWQRGDAVALIARCQEDPLSPIGFPQKCKNFYSGRVDLPPTGPAVMTIYKITNSFISSLTNQVIVPSTAGTLRFKIIGNRLTLSFRGKALTAADETNSNGYVGIDMVSHNSVTADNFQVYRLPFIDDFNRPDDSSLGPSWRQSAGSIMSIRNNKAAGFFGLSFATANRTPGSDVITSVEVDAKRLKRLEEIGLVARCQENPPRDCQNYYLGLIKRRNTAEVIVTMVIYKVVNNSFTPLTNEVPIPFTAGILRFETVGDKLTLSFKEQVLFASDSTYSGAGYVGMRIRGRGDFSPTVDNFQFVNTSNVPPSFLMSSTDPDPLPIFIAGQEFAFTLRAFDPDVKDVLVYSSPNLPIGSTLNPATGVFSWTPDAGGRYVITFEVADRPVGDTNRLTDTISIAINIRSFITIFTDNFNRPNNYYLGPNWQGRRAGVFIGIKNNKAALVDRYIWPLMTVNNLLVADAVIGVEADVSQLKWLEKIGLVARCQENPPPTGSRDCSNYYLGVIERSNLSKPANLIIYRYVNGISRILAQTTVPDTAGILRFKLIGNQITLSFEGPALTTLTAVDDVHSRAGYVGMKMRSRGNPDFAADNFRVEELRILSSLVPVLPNLIKTEETFINDPLEIYLSPFPESGPIPTSVEMLPEMLPETNTPPPISEQQPISVEPIYSLPVDN